VYYKRAEGSGIVQFESACTVLPNVEEFTAAEILQPGKPAAVQVRFHSMRKAEADDADLAAFFDGVKRRAVAVQEAEEEAGLGEPAEIPPVRFPLSAVAHLEIRHAEHAVQCPNVNLSLELIVGDFWRIDVQGEFSFKGSALGLTGADAGELRGYLYAGAFSPVPESFRPLDAEKAEDGALDALDDEDLF
jgi:hypothetical protein